MDDEIALVCMEIFTDIAQLDKLSSDRGAPLKKMLSAPIESFGVDSLTAMEFVMAVEERFAVDLDEKAVNRCRSVGDLATLVADARRA